MTAGHAIKHWGVTQPIVALSSGEAELIGIVRGAAQGLGFKQLAHDLGANCVVQSSCFSCNLHRLFSQRLRASLEVLFACST